jgi:hypothetical protein
MTGKIIAFFFTVVKYLSFVPYFLRDNREELTKKNCQKSDFGFFCFLKSGPVQTAPARQGKGGVGRVESIAPLRYGTHSITGTHYLPT